MFVILASQSPLLRNEEKIIRYVLFFRLPSAPTITTNCSPLLFPPGCVALTGDLDQNRLFLRCSVFSKLCFKSFAHICAVLNANARHLCRTKDLQQKLIKNSLHMFVITRVQDLPTQQPT